MLASKLYLGTPGTKWKNLVFRAFRKDSENLVQTTGGILLHCFDLQKGNSYVLVLKISSSICVCIINKCDDNHISSEFQ